MSEYSVDSGELLDESFDFKDITWKIPNVLSLPEVADYKPTPPTSAKKQLVGPISLEDCAGDVINDSQTLMLPNTLQLVQSELPLSEAENSNKLIGMFLFRQIISLDNINHKCLLCTTKSPFCYLLDLVKHYRSVHELASQTFIAEFSENIVFVCVPPDVTEQTTLNSVCRFCDITLKKLAEVRSHYPANHNKIVRLVQEQRITELSSSLFCSICSEMSENFSEHHTHMKNVHRMQTYVCKYCSFITFQANRLKTHVKQKHPQAASPQPTRIVGRRSEVKLKCPVCQLFINGKENLNQHILLAHSVQTGFDLQVPIDLMQGHDLGGQVGHSYGTLGTDMDLDSPSDINFDTLEPMLPSPPQDGDATHMAACYDTDV